MISTAPKRISSSVTVNRTRKRRTTSIQTIFSVCSLAVASSILPTNVGMSIEDQPQDTNTTKNTPIETRIQEWL